MLDLIQSSSHTLKALLSDILDLARVESGRLTIADEPFDLGAAVEEAAHLYAATAREKGLQFFVQMSPDAAGWVRGDIVRVKQVLTNLISNAVKFTSAGLVSLTVERLEHEDGEATLRFAVQDTGIGFSAEQKARLFNRFEQADGGITRQYGGSGLGLAICQQLSVMMGGVLDCESQPGGGSTFFLTLPHRPTAAPTPVAQTEAVDTGGAVVRVLLADDHPTNRRVVELILQPFDLDLTIVENGAEAVTAFRQSPFDLVLMDMQMPVMDGLTATQEIRMYEEALSLPRTPLVMLTANALPEHVAAGQAAGADGHLSKPFSAEDLIALVADPMSVLQSEERAAA
jgi:CheY-like chemotaxis protein